MTGPAAVSDGEAHVDRIRSLRGVLANVGVVCTSAPMSTIPMVPESSFEDAVPVETPAVTARPVPDVADVPDPVAFADGMQRFAVEGWVGVCPVVRASVSAAVLVRRDGAMTPVAWDGEDFLVVPDVMDSAVVDELRATQLEVHVVETASRQHPTLDVAKAAKTVAERRRAREQGVVARLRAEMPDVWLVVDGSLRGYEDSGDDPKLLGIIRSHEKQYLAGADLEVALTLAPNNRTTIFERRGSSGSPAYSWYIRLWDWDNQELLHGLLRLERPALPSVIADADAVSAWILSERVPLAGETSKWDRLLYPIHQVRTYLRARAGGWS